MKTCGQCIIYVPDMNGDGCSGCAVREYVGTVHPDTPACGRYIGRSEFLNHFSKGENGKYEIIPWQIEDRSDAAPVPRYWAKEHSLLTGEVTGYVPYCPSCNMMTVGKDQCEYCGQPFLPDQRSEEYFAPTPMETRDCPFCGKAGTYRYYRHSNGKAENGRCSACGAVVMDFPHGMKGLPITTGKNSPKEETE